MCLPLSVGLTAVPHDNPRDLALRPWSILIEGRERAFSDCATPSYRCYRHQAYTPVTTQMPCFATVSAADLALRGLFTPMRSCCQARICPRSSDPSWVASLYALSLHRAVARLLSSTFRTPRPRDFDLFDFGGDDRIVEVSFGFGDSEEAAEVQSRTSGLH